MMVITLIKQNEDINIQLKIKYKVEILPFFLSNFLVLLFQSMKVISLTIFIL